jgi:minor histocompatibility antigen H13
MTSPNSTATLANVTISNTVVDTVWAMVPFHEALDKHLPQDFWIYLSVYGQLLLSSVFVIYAGAHGALKRPPSAAPKETKGTKKRKEDPDHFAEGLQASDAIMFPIIASVILVGLYLLIKWLDDPTIISKVMRVYFSIASVASLAKLSADAMHFLLSLVFPRVWTDRSGQNYRIDPFKRSQWRLDDQAKDKNIADEKTSPFPGIMASLARLFLKDEHWWTIRHLFKEVWSIELGVHGLGKETFGVSLPAMLGAVCAVGLNTLYHFTMNKSINNLIGMGMCYGVFMILSCTSFATGTAVLVGLFLYDIVMVFYTPFMVTVATNIDAPIKLVFEGPRVSSLLGLGDIVVPGFFICFALRYDLWQFYQRKIKYVETKLATETEPDQTGKTASAINMQRRAEKAEYTNVQGRWGDWMWTSRKNKNLTAGLQAASFPKPCFHTGLAGYALGLITTLVVVLVTKRGQPALLYLVPSVIIPTWARGYFAGDLQDMWNYTEDGSLDTKEVVVEVDADGNVLKELSSKSRHDEGTAETKDEEKGAQPSRDSSSNEKEDLQEAKKVEKKVKARKEISHTVFLFKITAPGVDEVEDDD